MLSPKKVVSPFLKGLAKSAVKKQKNHHQDTNENSWGNLQQAERDSDRFPMGKASNYPKGHFGAMKRKQEYAQHRYNTKPPSIKNENLYKKTIDHVMKM